MYGTSEGDLRELGQSTVLCLPSVNIELSAGVTSAEFAAIQAQSPHAIPRGEKVLVRSIRTHDASINHLGVGMGFTITLPPSGEQVRFNATIATPLTGGSSANIAHALFELGRKDIGILSAVGDDFYGHHIIATLRDHGFPMAMLHREETAMSLILREPDGVATLFACKPSYALDATMTARLTRTLRPAILIASGVREDDLPLVESLWQNTNSRVRVFSPHIDLVGSSEEGRQRCRELCSGADIVHLNAYETAWLLQLRGSDGRIAFPNDDATIQRVMEEQVAPLAKHIFCITLGERGSITYDKNRKRVVRQSIGECVEGGNPVGAGDVHLAYLFYCLRSRGKPIGLRAALEVASQVTAAKIRANDARPWAGIPDSSTRRPWVDMAVERFRSANSGGFKPVT